MNTKLLAGISLAAMAGSFWACGDGPINGKDSSDVIVESMFASPEELQSLKEQAEDECKTKDESCALMYAEYLNRGANPTPSSVTAPTSSASGPIQPQPGESSSSEALNNANKRSSSSHFELPSYAEEASSSSEAKPVTGLGSCAPETTPIGKNKSTTWKFKPNPSYPKATAFTDAMYEWTFGESATPAEYTITKKTATEAITYASAGLMNASVKVTMPDGSSEIIACDPLQVDGDPITNCTCAPDEASPDVKDGPVTVTWTVDGCKSDSPIAGYEWTGVTGVAGTATATAAFSEKGQEVAPVVKVTNADNTTKPFTCVTAKAVNASLPDYIISVEGDQIPTDSTSSVENVENEASVVVNVSWTNAYYHPGVALECKVTCDQNGDLNGKKCHELTNAVQISVGGGTEVSGQHEAAAEYVLSDSMEKGDVISKSVSVKFSGLVKGDVASCKLKTFQKQN